MSEQQSLVVDGTEVVIEGDGPHTVLMIHGWPDNYRLWDSTVAALKTNYRCARFTLPGFVPGQPRRAWPLAELVALFLKIADAVSPGQKITLMVHDWGAVFGYEFAMRHPQRIERLIGVDIGDANSPDYARELSGKAKWQIFSYQIWLAAAWLLRGNIGNRMSRKMTQLMRYPLDASDVHCNMNYPYFIQWSGMHGGYSGRLQVRPAYPMLFIYGTKKPFMFHSSAWLDWLRAKPHSEVHALKSGHWVMENQAEQFQQIVVDWLRRTDALTLPPA